MYTCETHDTPGNKLKPRDWKLTGGPCDDLQSRATVGCTALALNKHWTLGSITALSGADKHDWLHVGYLFQISHSVNSALICCSQEMLTICKATFLSSALAETMNTGKLADPKHCLVAHVEHTHLPMDCFLNNFFI